MHATERRDRLAEILATHGRVSVLDAAAEMGVSDETIRRDLSALERFGLARRVHGGAVARTSVSSLESGLDERRGQHVNEKVRIARAALEFLPAAGGSMIIDAGTSTAALTDALPTDRPLVAFVHGMATAAAIAGATNIDLHVIGGRVRTPTAAAVGAETVESYRRIGVDVAFVGTNGVSLSRGLTTADIEEAAVKRAIVGAASTVVVLADSSKLGAEFVVTFGTFDDVDVVITDQGADAEIIDSLLAAGVEVIVA